MEDQATPKTSRHQQFNNENIDFISANKIIMHKKKKRNREREREVPTLLWFPFILFKEESFD